MNFGDWTEPNIVLCLFSGLSVKCYVGIEPEGERWTACDLDRGMRTCYTKYNWSKKICICEKLLFNKQEIFLVI